jgi:NAD(P)-dependent dehydrogenase (short-subunit alcohol dehydrogenase family)
MKIIVVGASGLIGSAIVKALADRHQVISASRKSADHPADITDTASLKRLFETVGKVDAVISAAGGAAYKPLADLTDADFAMSLGYKLMGQINLARLAVPYVNDNGSITLTTGVYAKEPPPGAAAIAVVNAGVNGYAIGAAGELPRGIRINAVSPPLVGEFRLNGAKSVVESMTPQDVARAYVMAVEGHGTGQIIDTRPYARR